MIHLRLFSSCTLVFACLTSFLMRGSLGQKPVLSVGSFTSSSNLQCIKHTMDIVSLEGSVNLNGSDASEWLANGVELRSPQTLICTASLTLCPPLTQSECYCEQFNDSTQTYTVKFNRPAEISLSEQSIFMRIVSSDFMESAMSGQTVYPYVTEDVSARISYGSKSKSVDLNGTVLDIPADNLLVNMTIDGLRQPFTIFHNTDIRTNNIEVTNEDHVSILLTITTSVLTVGYEEDQYCERDGSYTFIVTSVQRQSPYLDMETVTDPACPVDGQGVVSMTATINLAGADISDWFPTLYFRSEDNQQVCSALLSECPPSDVSAHECYCQQRLGDVFTVIANHEASSSLSGKDIHLEMFSADISVLQRSESVMYPLIDRDDVQITMTYTNDNKNRRYSPPVNQSILEDPEDNQQLIFTVNGLIEPFSIVYAKLNMPVSISTTNNQSSVTFSIDDDVERIRVSYKEDLKCQREATYYFSFDDDSSDDLSTGAIVGIVFGGILFVVIVILFIIVYLLIRAGNTNKGRYQRSTSDSAPESGTIIDYSSKDADEGRIEENGTSYQNKAYVVDMPANSSSVVMNPMYDEANKEIQYTSLDATTQNEPGPTYEGLRNEEPVGSSPDAEEEPNGIKPTETVSDAKAEPSDAKPTETGPSHIELEEAKPQETTSGVQNDNDVNQNGNGPYISIISTSL